MLYVLLEVSCQVLVRFRVLALGFGARVYSYKRVLRGFTRNSWCSCGVSSFGRFNFGFWSVGVRLCGLEQRLRLTRFRV